MINTKKKKKNSFPIKMCNCNFYKNKSKWYVLGKYWGYINDEPTLDNSRSLAPLPKFQYL